MHFDRLEISRLRNIDEAALDLSPGLNFFHGDNGAGKTAILEAAHLLVRGRSFRSHRPRELIQRDQEQLLVRATLIDPALGSRIVLHCHNLRLMRSMQDTSVARLCTTFNSYHLAAQSFVRDALLSQFHRTEQRDVVVLAGFGRFGQTIMEELEAAAQEIERMFVIDIDADRRMLVAEEQQRLQGTYERIVLQGDISHPEVWRRLTEQEDLSRAHPTILLGTGRAEDNLRTALWIKRKYPNALVFARTNDQSQLAEEVGSEHGIETFSIKQLTEDNIPPAWLPTSYRA